MIRKTAKRMLRKLRSNDYRPLNRIELSRTRLLHNVAVMQKTHREMTIFPVLKGNAYGHGLNEVAAILNKADIGMLAVDGYFEAARIRDISRHRILVMGYILPQNVHLLDTKRCSFVVQDLAGLEAFATLKRRVRVHLELNTGMNRLGLNPDELAAYLKMLKTYPQLQLEGIMTHLADADNPGDDSFTAGQVKAFDEQVEKILASGFQPAYIHIAQTAGSTKAKSKYANTIRLGIGLYGINPLDPKDEHAHKLDDLRPVLELKSTIIKTIDLKKGDRVSYNGIFTALHDMRIAVLPLGYYEGVSRALSNKGIVTAGSRRLPLVGRVCMNHTMIDISGTDLQVFDEVTVIGADPNLPNSILGMQREYGLFSYSSLTDLSESIRRVAL